MSFIYLGSPYSHLDPEIMLQRFESVKRLTASLLVAGHHVYSPIVHCHELAHDFDLPKDGPFWEDYNFAMLGVASQLWVHMQDGWNESKGLEGEMDQWMKQGQVEPRAYVPIRWVSNHGDDYLVTTHYGHEEIIKGVAAL